MKARGIVGEILASWEDAANTAAIDCHNNAEDDASRLLRYGLELPTSATQEEREDAMRLAWEAVENGREMAKAWRLVSDKLRRLLRAMRVENYSQRRAKETNQPAAPWQKHHEHEVMMQTARVEPRKIERAPVALDKGKIEMEARTNGLWVEHEPKE